jgi:hypothetical protein
VGSTTLRPQRALVSLGFVLVGVGGLPLLAYGSVSPGDQDFYWIVTAIGYGVLAWASSSWLAALTKRQVGVTGMRRVLRLFALACLLLGVAYLGFINEVIELHRHHDHGIRYQAASDALSLFGFGLAALGFWTSASAVETEASSSEHATPGSRQVEPTAPLLPDPAGPMVRSDARTGDTGRSTVSHVTTLE